MSQTETEGALEDLMLKFEGMGYPPEIAEKLAREIMYGRGVAQENEYVVRPGRGYNLGGSVDMNQYGLGQLGALPFSSLDRDEALPAPTPEKAMSRALSGKEGDVPVEYLVALAKANKAKSKTAKDYYMQEAQKVLNKDLFSSNMGMFG